MTCAHCRAPTSAGAQFCCNGCEAVYQALQGSGLADWYRLRDIDRDALRGVAARPRAGDRYGYLDAASYRSEHCTSVQTLPSPSSVNTVGATVFDAVWSVDGMTCVACAWLIESLANEQIGVLDARVDVLAGRLEFRFTELATLSTFAQALGRFGYGVRLAGEADDPGEARRRDLVDVAIAGALMGNTMLLVLPYYLGLEPGGFAALFGWVALVLGLVALAVPGRVFLRNAASALRTRRISLDVPIALGLVAAWVYSAAQLLRGDYAELYLDSLTMLIFSLRVGRFFQARTVERAVARARMLAATMPDLIAVKRDGRWQQVAAETLVAGEQLRLDPGCALPTESRLRRGAFVDLQVVTGEEAPVHMMPGARLPAGARAVDEVLELDVLEAPMQATAAVGSPRTTAPSTAAGGSGRDRRSPAGRRSERMSTLFTVAVLLLAFGGLVFWTANDGIGAGLRVAMVVLIVACPCAIGLAWPTIGALATAEAARRGVLVRDGDVWARIGDIGAVVLDKTGTLTEGRPEVVRSWWASDTVPDRAQMAGALADIESTSRHPVARGVLRYLQAEQGAREVADGVVARAYPGEGVVGSARGLDLTVCSAAAALRFGVIVGQEAADFVADAARARLSTVVVGCAETAPSDTAASITSRPVVLAFGLRDAVRADASATLQRLRSDHGVRLLLCSGDHDAATHDVAARVGISDVHANASPTQKAALVTALSADHAVAMIGDGYNDVAAMHDAAVAISPAGATPAAIAASDVVLAHGGLSGVAFLFDRARAVRRDTLLTLTFATVYNAATIGLALSGHVTPLLAALLMPLSSFAVVGLASTLARSANRPDRRPA